MIKRWFDRLLVNKRPSPTSHPPLEAALVQYQQALNRLSREPQTWLPVLLARDQVKNALSQANSPPLILIQELLTLDKQLQDEGKTYLSLSDLSLTDSFTVWRRTLHPADTNWWWMLDKEVARQEESSDLPWNLLTGTFVIFTVPIATDLISKLWDSAPDPLSILGTLFTLLLTGSPFTKQGREFAQWILNRVTRLPHRLHSEAMTAMAILAFVGVLVIRLFFVPWLAIYYNDQGFDALRSGHLTGARNHFQRAVALNDELAESYYNLANVYEEIARPEDAIHWYQQALEHDLELNLAYNNLGRLYIVQGELEQASRILRAGLVHAQSETEVDKVTRYRLLANLGWVYYEQEQYKLAAETLEEAISLESELDTAFIATKPHYFLALAYERLERPADALKEWEESLRYLAPDDPVTWEETIRSHLEELRQAVP